MKKTILVYGLITGAILITLMIVMVHVMFANPEYKSHDLLGYAVMLVILSLIFFGVRDYRNKELGGYITFGKALKTGALITLVASTLYVVVWLVYYYLFVPDFIDQYTEHVLYQCTTEAEIEDKTKEMKQLKEWYQNPLWVILLTYAEVLPMGLGVALVSSLILKKKDKTGQEA